MLLEFRFGSYLWKRLSYLQPFERTGTNLLQFQKSVTLLVATWAVILWVMVSFLVASN